MSDCDVCNDFNQLQQATCDEKAFRWHTIKALCAIITLLAEEEEEEDLVVSDTVLEQVLIAAVTIESTYSAFASPGFIDTTKQLKYIRIINTSNVDLAFSYNGGEFVAFTVIAGTTYTNNVELILPTLTSFQMKKVSGTASTGSVYIEGSY